MMQWCRWRSQVVSGTSGPLSKRLFASTSGAHVQRVHVKHHVPATHRRMVTFADLVAFPVPACRLHEKCRAEALVAITQGHELHTRDAFAKIEANLDGHGFAVLLGHLVVVAHV